MQQRKIRVFLFIVGFFLSFAGRSQDSVASGGALTLQQCVDIAIKNNLLVRQRDLQMQSAGVNYKQAKDYMLPTLNAQGGYGINFGRSLNQNTYTYSDQQFNSGSYNINAGLNLFSGLQVLNGIKQNAFLLEASRMDWQQQKDAITLNVILAYLQILSSQDLLLISRAQADVDAKQVARLDIMMKDGAVQFLSTYYDLKGQYAGDLVAISNGINAVESAKINLFGLLNIPYTRDASYERIPMDLMIPEYGKSSDSIYQTALSNLPIIKSVDLKAKASEKALGVARGVYYPTLSAYGSLGSNYSSVATSQTPSNIFSDTSKNSYVTVAGGDHFIISNVQNFDFVKIPFGDQLKNNRYEQIGLQLNIPILYYFRARNNVKLAKINLKNAQILARSTRNDLQQQVELAYQNMINAYESYKSFRDQVAAYSESFRATEIRFNAGALTSVDYIIAKNNIDRANTNFTASKYNYIFRTKILDYYQGKLTW
jgi:outer membrane protein